MDTTLKKEEFNQIKEVAVNEKPTERLNVVTQEKANTNKDNKEKIVEKITPLTTNNQTGRNNLQIEKNHYPQTKTNTEQQKTIHLQKQTIDKKQKTIEETRDIFLTPTESGKSVNETSQIGERTFFFGSRGSKSDDIKYLIKWHYLSKREFKNAGKLDQTSKLYLKLFWPRFKENNIEYKLKPTWEIRHQGPAKKHDLWEENWWNQTSWSGYAVGWSLKDIEKCSNYSVIKTWINKVGGIELKEFWIIFSQDRWYGVWALSQGTGVQIPVDNSIANWGTVKVKVEE